MLIHGSASLGKLEHGSFVPLVQYNNISLNLNTDIAA
jgi:hypothetical protein